MTDNFWLEFDEDKLAILKREAYELDLSLEEYLSEMIEDMVSFNREKTEDETNMDKYKTIKWKDREVESSAIERFSEEWSGYIEETIEDYFYEDEDDDERPLRIKSNEDCIRYVVDQCGENLEESMGFRCEYLIEEVTKDLLKNRQ